MRRRWHDTRIIGILAALLLGLSVLPSAMVGPAVPVAYAATATFTSTGAAQTWQVPSGVTFAQFDVYGAQGGGTPSGGGVGGRGGHASAILSVTPAEVLQINVGGQGGSGVTNGAAGGGGFNGGAPGGSGGFSPAGGGGGASDVRRDANSNSTYALDERL